MMWIGEALRPKYIARVRLVPDTFQAVSQTTPYSAATSQAGETGSASHIRFEEVSAMIRAFSALAVAGLCVVSAGCAVCASPYDDCSPTFLGGCDEHCVTDDRAGSIITGYEGQYIDGQAPATPDRSAEEVPRPSPIPDPGMQQAPDEQMQPMPRDGAEEQPLYRPTPSPTAQRSGHSYAPMTLRPQRHRLR